MSAVVAVRLTEPIRSALAKAAADDFATPAAVARQAIVRDLRKRGYVAAPKPEPADD